MTFKIADRVKDTTTTTGTGTVTLSGTAPSGFQSFNSGIGDGNSTCYCIKDANGTGWEVGIGTYTNSGTTLSRTTVLASSNAGSAITLSSGTHTVFVTEPAAAGITGLYGGQIVLPTPTSAGTGLSTWLSQGVAAVQDSADGILLSVAENAGDEHWHLRTMASPGTPYTITTLLAATFPNTGNICEIGIGWTDNTKLHLARMLVNNATGPGIDVAHYSSTTVWVANDTTNSDARCSPLVWFQLRDDGTNVFWKFSHDGVDYATLFSIAKSSGYLGSSGYSNVCIGVASNSSSTNKTTLLKVKSWFQGP